MSLTLTFTDVGLRILLTALASAALGFERSVRGHPAGVKTTMLVALAACLSMLQANWLRNVTQGQSGR
jgi:putative Mg2+ transporter-C (MgtC) family protein